MSSVDFPVFFLILASVSPNEVALSLFGITVTSLLELAVLVDEFFVHLELRESQLLLSRLDSRELLPVIRPSVPEENITGRLLVRGVICGGAA
jgi:hypothetical protein